MIRYISIICLLCYAQWGAAQINAVNLMEVQYGKLPNEAADPFVSIYDRLKADYFKGDWQAGVTIESYGSKYDDRNYLALSQAYLRYEHANWDFKVGNLYETIGRGLLLRSFEIPGAVLEDIGFRSRTYFHKDILGASAQYKGAKADVQVLYGQVLNNVLPPTFDREERRPDDLFLINTNYKYYKKHSLGLTVAGLNSPNIDLQPLTALRWKGPLTKQFNYYGEWAENWEIDNSRAIYLGIAGSLGRMGINVEYKKYQNFILGAGVNEPPALIKQHTYKVLNRSTHVSNPDNEEGYQLDLYYTMENGSSININHALASNASLGTFQEYFVEWSSAVSDQVDYKVFIDWAQDPFKGESDRWSIGSYWSVPLGKGVVLSPEVEYQQFDRSGTTVDNQVYGLTLKLHRKWTTTLLWETSSDPFIVDDGESRRSFLGATIGFRPDYNHRLQLFVGERRGGPACSGGVCYEILDFRGVETRWTARF